MTVVRTTWTRERIVKGDDSESVTCYGIQVKILTLMWCQENYPKFHYIYI